MAPRVRIEPIGRVRCQTSLWRSSGVLRLTAITKATFAFVDEEVGRQLDPVAIGLRDKHFDSNPRRSTFESFEVAPYIPGVGVTLVGTAYPEGGRTMSSMSVRLCIYDEDTPVLEKTLHVFGERSAEDPRVSRPLTPMPIVYERAIGGRENLAGSSLYNVVSPIDPSRPGSFAPVPLAWRALGGRGLDPQAMKASPMEIPEGFDFGFFSSAPYDQRLRSLNGNEWILLDGLNERAARTQTRLPGAESRALFRFRTGSVWTSPTEIVLTLDTVVIDAEEETFSLLFRGSVAVDERADEALVHAGIDLPDTPLTWPSDPDTSPRGEGALPIDPRRADSEAGARPASVRPQPTSPSVGSTMNDQGGIFETVVGTLDEILASMPALPFTSSSPLRGSGGADLMPRLGLRPSTSHGRFEVSPSAEHRVSTADELAPSIQIPATPWDVPAPREPVVVSQPKPRFQVDETMDVAAARHLIGAGFEDMGTVTGNEEPIGSEALPFKVASSVSPAQAPPLGVPRALPFEERQFDPTRVAPAMSRPQRGKSPTMQSASLNLQESLQQVPSPSLLRNPSAEPSRLADRDPSVVVERASVASVDAANIPTVGASTIPVATGPDLSRASSQHVGPPPRTRAGTLQSGAIDTSRDSIPEAPTAVRVAPMPTDDEPLATSEWSPESAAAVFEGASTGGSTRDSFMGPPDASQQLRKEVKSRLAQNTSLADLSLVGANLSGLDLSGRNLSGLDLTNANLTRCILRATNLSRAKLEGALFAFASAEEADFETADLTRARCSGGVFDRANFERATLDGTDLTGASLQKAILKAVNGPSARFDGAKLDEADLRLSKLNEASLVGATLVGVQAGRADLSRADLSKADLSEASFRNAKLAEAKLRNAIVAKADFRDAHLVRADLTGVDRESARFAGADLDGAEGITVG